MNWTRFNPLSWGWPLRIIVGLAVALVLYQVVSGGAAVIWARHVANKALKGIARTLSDYDKIEADGNAKEQAIGELARQAQELEKQAAAERAGRVEMARQLETLRKKTAEDDATIKRLKIEDASRPRIMNTTDAVAAMNKALRRNP